MHCECSIVANPIPLFVDIKFALHHFSTFQSLSYFLFLLENRIENLMSHPGFIGATTCDVTTCDSRVKLEQPHVMLPYVIHM